MEEYTTVVNKVASKVIANRFEKVLNSVISHDQTVFFFCFCLFVCLFVFFKPLYWGKG